MDLVTKKFMELGFEKIMPIQNIGSCLRVSETQIPSIYKIYKESCDALRALSYIIHNHRTLRIKQKTFNRPHKHNTNEKHKQTDTLNYL